MTGQQVMARIRERDDGEMLDLVKRIATAHAVTLMELLESRQGGPTDARHALWNALYERGHWSGRRLGQIVGRTSETVLAGIRDHRKRNGLAPLIIRKGSKYVPPGEADISQGAT